MASYTFVSTMGGVAWGGSEELWAGAASRLLLAGHRVDAHVFRWRPDPPQIAALERQGASVSRRERWLRLPARVLYAGLGRPTSHKPFSWRERAKPTLVVISQGHTMDGVAIMQDCIRRGWRYSVVVQSAAEAIWPDDIEAEAACRAYGEAARIFFVSSRNRQMLADQLGSPIENGELVSNPFTVRQAPVLVDAGEAGPLRLACVARLDPVVKGQDLLLRLLATEKWRARAIDVGFFGQGRCAETVERLASSLGLRNVRFEGHVDDIEAIWSAHHALILPSRAEGTPLALIEAMLCARTAIVTDVGGNAELVEDGVSGFVAKAPTVPLLDEALERAWIRRGEMAALGQAARKRVLSCIPADPIGDFTQRLLELS